MSTRYLSNATLALAGGFLVVASQAFAEPTFKWLALGIGIAAVALSGLIALQGRGTVQRGLDAVVAGLGVWTIVETLVFTANTNIWLGFSSGAALVAIALAGLTAHEYTTERVVHSFEVSAGADLEREYSHSA